MHAYLSHIGDSVDRLLEALWQAQGTDLLLTAGLTDSTLQDAAPVVCSTTAHSAELKAAELRVTYAGAKGAGAQRCGGPWQWR